MIYIIIFIGIFLYLIIGRIYANFLVDNGMIDYEEEHMTLVMLFLPITVIWFSARWIGDKISDMF